MAHRDFQRRTLALEVVHFKHKGLDAPQLFLLACPSKYRLFSGFRRMLCLFGRCRPWGTDNGHDSWRIFTFVRAFAVLLMGTRIALFERKRWVRGYITADVRPSPRWTFSVFAEIDRKSPLIFSRCRQALATHNADALNGGMPRSVEPMLKEVWRRLVTQAVE